MRAPPPGQFSSTIPSPVFKVGAFSVKESHFPVPDETKINDDCVYCFGSLLNCHSQQLEGRFPGIELTFLIVDGFWEEHYHPVWHNSISVYLCLSLSLSSIICILKSAYKIACPLMAFETSIVLFIFSSPSDSALLSLPIHIYSPPPIYLNFLLNRTSPVLFLSHPLMLPLYFPGFCRYFMIYTQI